MIMMNFQILGRGISWIDAGSYDSLLEIGNFIQIIERRQSLKIGCIEEVSLRMNFISIDKFENLIANMPNCKYKDYLDQLAEEYRSESFAQVSKYQD